jgi:hypothetical protein
MSFANLKKNSQSAIDKISKEMTKLTSKGNYEDDRFWTLERDKSGNGYAVIRFLPPVEGEDIPWVRVFSHGFQGKGGWFIENCPTTLGKKCPVCEGNNELWNSGIESNKGIARDRKRKLSYIANILVVSDPTNKDNDGKVFLFKFGKKIFDKLQDAMNPTTPDETKINPFDFWQGANFKLKAAMVDGYVSYEKSAFQAPSELLDGDDKKLESLWKTQYPLQPFVAPDQFKAYEELKGRMDQVLHGGASEGSAMKAEEAVPEDFRSKMKTKTPAMDEAPAKKPAKAPAKAASDDEDEDAFAYFKKLADDDE